MTAEQRTGQAARRDGPVGARFAGLDDGAPMRCIILDLPRANAPAHPGVNVGCGVGCARLSGRLWGTHGIESRS